MCAARLNVRKLKEELRENQIDRFCAEMASGVAGADLISIREQKLLLTPTDAEVRKVAANAYSNAAASVWNGDDLNAATNYAHFAVICAAYFEGCRSFVRNGMTRLKTLRQEDVLVIAEELVTEFTGAIEKGLVDAIQSHQKIASRDERTEVSDYLLHEYHGLNNDTRWAVLRALNEVFIYAETSSLRKPTRRARDDAREELKRLYKVALGWNNYSYLLDKVTYGEWKIAKLVVTTKTEVVFDVCDPVAELAKMMGIRRHVADHARRDSGTGHNFNKIVATAIDIALAAALEVACEYRIKVDPNRCRADLLPHINKFVTMVNAEDAIVLSSSDLTSVVHLDYIAAIMLWSSMLGIFQMAEGMDRRDARRIRSRGVPLSFFRRLAKSQDYPAEEFDTILRSQLSTIPVRHFFELVKRPYLLTAGRVHLIDGCMHRDWCGEIRARRIKGGATGFRFGKAWEERCAEAFGRHGWNVLGRGITLRDCNHTVTDVDILVLRLPLLLVVQCKALGICADTVYEHWLARSKIIQGSEQACLACDHLKRYPRVLNDILKKSGVSVEEVQLQPLVITSSGIFTGWNPGGVPVANDGTILSILRGAVVKYTDSRGTTLGETRHISGTTPTAEEFVELLRTPIGWRVASKSGRFQHRVVETPFEAFSLPELTMPTDTRAQAILPDLILQS